VKYVCVSGGADSTALALLLWERGEEFEMVFADTGVELPEVYYLLPRLAQRVGRKLHVVSGGGFFCKMVNRGYFIPSKKKKWCCQALKQKPQDEFFKAVQPEEIFIGIRADEPKRIYTDSRSGFPESYPLFKAGIDRKAAHDLCAKYGLLNPCYKWRSRVSCYCCYEQRKSDWIGLLRYHPTLYLTAEEWERQSLAMGNGYTFRKGQTLEALRRQWEHNLYPELEPEPEEPCLIGGEG
jgi:hypothetical protein